MTRMIITARSDDFTISIPAAPAVNYAYDTIPITFTDIFFRDYLQQIVPVCSQQAKSMIYSYKMEIQNFQGARIAKVDTAGNNLSFTISLRRFIAGTTFGARLLPMLEVSQWQELNNIIFNPLYDDSTVLITPANYNLLVDLRNADTAFDGITIAKMVISLDIEVN